MTSGQIATFFSCLLFAAMRHKSTVTQQTNVPFVTNTVTTIHTNPNVHFFLFLMLVVSSGDKANTLEILTVPTHSIYLHLFLFTFAYLKLRRRQPIRDLFPMTHEQ